MKHKAQQQGGGGGGGEKLSCSPRRARGVDRVLHRGRRQQRLRQPRELVREVARPVAGGEQHAVGGKLGLVAGRLPPV